jgi:hypothetical protein
LEQASEKTSENDQPPVAEVEDKSRRGRPLKKQPAAEKGKRQGVDEKSPPKEA